MEHTHLVKGLDFALLQKVCGFVQDFILSIFFICSIMIKISVVNSKAQQSYDNSNSDQTCFV